VGRVVQGVVPATIAANDARRVEAARGTNPEEFAAAFEKATQDAKADCPVSRLLNTAITLAARLA
jgi:hypothetical protein